MTLRIDNLYLINDKFFFSKTKENPIPNTNEEIIKIEKVPEFNISTSGSRLIVFILKDKFNEYNPLIIQQQNKKYYIVYPEEIDYLKEYNTTKILLLDVFLKETNLPNVGDSLYDISDEKKMQLSLLYQQYLIQTIDSNFINNLTENNLQELINHCKKIDNWNLLNKSIEDIFSNRLNLLNSFLKEDFSNNISINKEFSSTASATPKSKIFICSS